MTRENIVVVALGGNLVSMGKNPQFILKACVEKIRTSPLHITSVSKWYTTPAFPANSGPNFVNAAFSATTNLSPDEVLALLHQVEAEMGRERDGRWGPRVCDLDLISHGDSVLPDRAKYEYWRDLPLETQQASAPKQLILPHPRLQDRAFVLIPLRDVAPDWNHPVSGESLAAMIARLPKEDVAAVSEIGTTE